MNGPEFTPEEQMIVGYYKSNRGHSYVDALSLEATYVIATFAMVALGAYYDSYLLAASALFVYTLLKLRETLQQPPTMRLTASIIQKYEARIAELSTRGNSPSTT